MQVDYNFDKQQKVVAKKQPRTKKTKKWVKPKGMPKRPLSAYNIFFSNERQSMLDRLRNDEENPVTIDGTPRKVKIGFANLARTVASKWKNLSDEEKQPFIDQAQVERERYKTQVKIWQDLGLDPRRDHKKPRSSPACTCQEESHSRPSVSTSAAAVSINDRSSFFDPGFDCLWTPTSMALHRLHRQGEKAAPFLNSAEDESLAASTFLWEPLSSKGDDFAVTTYGCHVSSNNSLLLEPLPIEKFVPSTPNAASAVDSQQLTTKLSRELRGKLDNDEVGFLRSAFARSA